MVRVSRGVLFRYPVYRWSIHFDVLLGIHVLLQ